MDKSKVVDEVIRSQSEQSKKQFGKKTRLKENKWEEKHTKKSLKARNQPSALKKNSSKLKKKYFNSYMTNGDLIILKKRIFRKSIGKQ